MKDLDILMALQFHSIGKCEKHLRYYEQNVSNLIIKYSTVGYQNEKVKEEFR